MSQRINFTVDFPPGWGKRALSKFGPEEDFTDTHSHNMRRASARQGVLGGEVVMEEVGTMVERAVVGAETNQEAVPVQETISRWG